VPYGSRPRLPVEASFGAAMSYGSGPRLPAGVLSDTTMCPTAPCVSRALSIKKSLAGLPVPLGTHVPNAHAHVSNALDVRAIMRLQDVWTDSIVNAYKACRQASTVQL
jgi:hypothetical protein